MQRLLRAVGWLVLSGLALIGLAAEWSAQRPPRLVGVVRAAPEDRAAIQEPWRRYWARPRSYQLLRSDLLAVPTGSAPWTVPPSAASADLLLTVDGTVPDRWEFGLIQTDANATVGVYRIPRPIPQEPETVELALESLLRRPVRGRLGIVWIRFSEPPESLRLEPLGKNPWARWTIADGLTVPNPHGFEWLSPPLLTGRYRLDARFSNDQHYSTELDVPIGERVLIAWDTGRTVPTAPTAAPPTRTLRIRWSEEWGPFALTVAGSTGRLVGTLDPAEGLRVELLRDWKPPRVRWDSSAGQIILEGLPTEPLTVALWTFRPTAPGKVHWIGPAQRWTLPPDRSRNLNPKPPTLPRPAGTVHLYWRPFGPPEGATVWIDEQLYGELRNAAELLVELSPGTHTIRWQWTESSQESVFTVWVAPRGRSVVWLEPTSVRVIVPERF